MRGPGADFEEVEPRSHEWRPAWAWPDVGVAAAPRMLNIDAKRRKQGKKAKKVGVFVAQPSSTEHYMFPLKLLSKVFEIFFS